MTMNSSKYVPTPGAQLNAAQAQRYGVAIERMVEENGGITPHLLLAKAKGTDVEEWFDWSNEVAGPKWREEQASDLLRYIGKEVTFDDGVVKIVRAFLPVSVNVIERPNDLRYQSVSVVFSVPDLRQQVIESAIESLRIWQSKYEMYSELAAITAEIGMVLNKYAPPKKEKARQPRVRKPKLEIQPA